MIEKQTVYLEYLPGFDAYGLRKDVIEKMSAAGVLPEIKLPEKLQKKQVQGAPVIGFLLGQDKSADGTEYYSVSKNYLHAVLNTGADVRFMDFDNAGRQMKECDGAVLPGGAFNNPESFYIDGKTEGDKIGKRYYAYRDVIEEAYKNRKPLLGICAGAQMIGALLGNMKMYRNLKKEVYHPAVHKPENENDVRVHQIKLLPGTPVFEIMGLKSSDDHVIINSRHSQSMVQGVLQDYVTGTPKVKMGIYAVSDSDNIPEIWGNDKAGILCVQGHPEDLTGDPKMQNLYNYLARKAGEYKASRSLRNIRKTEYSR